jgi:hypothetical protein
MSSSNNKKSHIKEMKESMSSPQIQPHTNGSSSIVTNVTRTSDGINGDQLGGGARTSSTFTSTTSSCGGLVKSVTTGTRLMDATRDSGFGDSVMEDISTSSIRNSLLLSSNENTSFMSPSQSEHGILTHESIGGKLQTVQEATQPKVPIDTNDKDQDYITIVKTTKVITKVKHLKTDEEQDDNQQKNTTKSNNKKNKKGGKNKNKNNKKNNKTNENENEESKSDKSTESINNNNNNSEDEINKETLIKINIKKSTEEHVFESTHIEHTITTDNISSVLTTTADNQPNIVDLNSTVLDCEELLNEYPTVPETITTLAQQTPSKTVDDVKIRVLSESKEIPIEIEQKQTTAEPKKKRNRLIASFRFCTGKRRESKKSKTNQDNDGTVNAPTVHLQTTENKTKSMDATLIKYKLLDGDQKKRILHLKPQCIDLLFGHINNNNPNLQIEDECLKKTIARSLDLLRHDRIESFDKLGDQLKYEYSLSSPQSDSNSDSSEPPHKQLSKCLEELLIDKKVLLQLDLDPKLSYEESIPFSDDEKEVVSLTKSLGWQEPFDLIKRKALATVETTKAIEDDSTKPTPTINVDVTPTSVKVDAEAEAEVVEKKESKNEPKVDKAELLKGAHIVLDTVKEPEIVFPSDLDDTILNKPVLKSTTVTTATTKDEPKGATNDDVDKHKKKSTKKSGLPLLGNCLACAGGKKKPKSKEIQMAAVTTTTTVVQSKITESKIIDPTLFTNLDPPRSSTNQTEQKQEEITTEEDEENEETGLDTVLITEALTKSDNDVHRETIEIYSNEIKTSSTQKEVDEKLTEIIENITTETPTNDEDKEEEEKGEEGTKSIVETITKTVTETVTIVKTESGKLI